MFGASLRLAWGSARQGRYPVEHILDERRQRQLLVQFRLSAGSVRNHVMSSETVGGQMVLAYLVGRLIIRLLSAPIGSSARMSAYLHYPLRLIHARRFLFSIDRQQLQPRQDHLYLHVPQLLDLKVEARTCRPMFSSLSPP